MKRLATTSLVGLAAVFLSASDLSAQVCNGIAPFSAGKMRVGAGIRMPDGGNIFDGEFAIGSKSGVFGGARVSMSDPDGPADGTTMFGGFIGKPMMIDAGKTIEMCPEGFVMFGEESSNVIGGSVSFGKTFSQTSFDLIPFGAALLHRDDPGGTFDADFNLDINVGAGFVLNKKWTIRPTLNIPLTNTDFRDNIFGVAVFLNFGGTP